MMRTPLMIESPSRPGTDQRDLAWRRLAAAELWPSVNRRPSIHSADTQVQTGPACEWSGATGRDSVVSSPLREPRGTGRAGSERYDIDMKNGLTNQNEKTKQHHDQQQARQRGGSVASGWSGAPAAAAWCDGQQRPWLYEP